MAIVPDAPPERREPVLQSRRPVLRTNVLNRYQTAAGFQYAVNAPERARRIFYAAHRQRFHHRIGAFRRPIVKQGIIAFQSTRYEPPIQPHAALHGRTSRDSVRSPVHAPARYSTKRKAGSRTNLDDFAGQRRQELATNRTEKLALADP